jgi:hypothetical protein
MLTQIWSKIILLAVCSTAASRTEIKYQVELGYKMKNDDCGRVWEFGT